MTSTTLNGFGLEPQWDFSTFRFQLPEKLAVCPAQTPSATERNVGTNHERVLMADSSCVQVPAIRILLGSSKGEGDLLSSRLQSGSPTTRGHLGPDLGPPSSPDAITSWLAFRRRTVRSRRTRFTKTPRGTARCAAMST